MYKTFFGLSEAPFSIAPDPRYLFMSASHQEALAHLRYGLMSGGGFVVLTGEVGTGKTTVCRCLLEQIPETCDVAYVVNPKLTVAELLSTICTEFGIRYPQGNESIKVFIDCINEYLLDAHARGRHTVLIIDEAQNLSAEVLEQMRLLTNVETSQRKLLQIILLGQPELAEMLARPELRQLAQRVIARYDLRPLEKAEVAAYVRHRLEISGGRPSIVPDALMGRVHRMSRGIPRVVNLLCDRALLGAYAQGKDKVDRRTLAHAAREVCFEAAGRRMRAFPAAAVAITATVIVAAAAGVVALAIHRGDEGASREPPALGPTAAAAPLAGVPTKLPATLSWPADETSAQSKAAAYAALFRAWGIDRSDANLCEQPQRGQLRCQSARGGLDDLRRLNRPAVLQMRDDKGRELYACLIGLDGSSATFAAAGNRHAVALSALATHWSGHYTVLSRLPPELAGTPGGRHGGSLAAALSRGARGPAVAWLDRQLALAGGRAPTPGAEAVFDDALVREVKEFQLARGLVPDGAVGELTLMHLAGVAEGHAPTLTLKP